ncbi:metallophosphoesterase [Pedobacter gandavensis]|uniref:metallophosphoesterase n=1 Tax=Pedobacter gandavensis TaxID=2679963 RepID=UPI00292FB00C|nr:metallophosphoesterase [Pedobacter gandavensis]
MKRRNFLKSGITAAALLHIGTPGEARTVNPDLETKAFDNEVKMVGFPTLMSPYEDTISIVWQTDQPSVGWVEYGTDEKCSQKQETQHNGLAEFFHVHKVTLRGLKPGTTYYFRTCIESPLAEELRPVVKTDPQSFKTLNSKAGTISFGIINDTHENQPVLDRIQQINKDFKPDFLCWNGDQINDPSSEKQITTALLNPTKQAFTSGTPLVYVRGNHDTRGSWASQLSRYLSVPNGAYYYHFIHGPVAFTVLDTGEDKPDQHKYCKGRTRFEPYRDEQAIWLDRALSRKDMKRAAFNVVLLHIPLFTKSGWDSPDSRGKWLAILQKHKVDLLISGHTHTYEFVKPGEITESSEWLDWNKKTKVKASIPQLVGGGPKLEGEEFATYIKGEASAKELKISVLDMKGNTLDTYTFPGSKNPKI